MINIFANLKLLKTVYCKLCISRLPYNNYMYDHINPHRIVHGLI